MKKSDEQQQKVEAYLARLSSHLRGFDEADVREIVEELRSHILEKITLGGEAPETVLAALGSPEELAGQYTADDLLARAELSRSPFRLLKDLVRWASLSVAGLFVLLGSILGYFLGGALVLCALLKSFHPHTAGLWLLPTSSGDVSVSLRLGFSSPPVGGRELLGWWIIPIGLGVGFLLMILTTSFALWCARRSRRSLRLPRTAHR